MSRYSRAETTASSFAEADWSLIERIIDAVPVGETGFEAVSAAYDEVMEHAGLDAEEEDRHYRLLLKIHEMKAPTLQARMEKWKSGSRELRSSVGERTGGTVTLDMLDLDDTQERQSAGTAPDDGRNDVRSRVPFLADAGSDPDEDGDDELDQQVYDEVDAETTVDYTEGQGDSGSSSPAVDDQRMPSTRPHNNAFVTPVRYPQQNHVRQASTSEAQRRVHHQPERPLAHRPHQPPLSPSPEKRSLVSSTPASHRSATAPSPPIRALRAVHDDEYRKLEDEAFELERVYEVEQGQAARARQMRQQAAEFHAYGLKSRAMREWLKELQYEQTDLNDLIGDLDRSRLHHALSRWRNKVDSRARLYDLAARTHTRALQGDSFRRWARQTKDKRDEENCRRWVQRKDSELMADAWLEWKERNIERRRRRWEDDMKEKELVISEKVESRITKQSFKLWRLARLCKQSVGVTDRQLARDSLLAWRGLCRQRKELRKVEASLTKERNRRLLCNKLGDWRSATRLRIAEADVRDLVDDRLEGEAWQVWRKKSSMIQRADSHCSSALLRRAWTKWSSGMDKYKALAQISYKIHAEQEAAAVGSALTHWLIKMRALQVSRRKEMLTTKRAFTIWRERTRNVQAGQVKAEAMLAQRELRGVVSCLKRWADRSGHLAQTAKQAVQHRDRAISRVAFGLWRGRVAQHAQDDMRAVTLRAFQLQRHALIVWRAHLSRREQENWVRDREMHTLASHFHTWLQSARQQRKLRDLEAEHHNLVERRQLKNALRTWVTRVVDNKSAEYDAKAAYDTKVVRVAFSAWTKAILRQGEALSLCQSFRDVREEATRHRLFHFWQAAAQHRTLLRRMSEEEEKRRDEQRVREAFAAWRYKRRDAELQRLAPRIVLQRDDALLLAAFDSWKARSRRLPALAFEKLKMKRKAWDIWRAALPAARQLREVTEQSNAVILGSYLDQWKRAYRSKVARRASARRRSSAGMLRLRPSTGSEASIASAPYTPAPAVQRSARRRSGLYAPSLP